ncbi:hypothetical protein QMP26_24190 [Enterocloster clostridioformis]|nr:hypothetical protein [Enterocloster clostridioformis]
MRFKSLQNKRKFNFAAALFGGFGFGYRKMWLEGVAVMAFCTLLFFLQSAVYYALLYNRIFDLDKTYDLFKWLTYIVKFIIIGFVADSIYWKNIKKRIDFLHLPEDVRENKLGLVTVFKECKGVSIWLGALPMSFWYQFFSMVKLGIIGIIGEFVKWIF